MVGFNGNFPGNAAALALAANKQQSVNQSHMPDMV
jgi:hypothetical protein